MVATALRSVYLCKLLPLRQVTNQPLPRCYSAPKSVKSKLHLPPDTKQVRFQDGHGTLSRPTFAQVKEMARKANEEKGRELIRISMPPSEETKHPVPTYRLLNSTELENLVRLNRNQNFNQRFERIPLTEEELEEESNANLRKVQGQAFAF